MCVWAYLLKGSLKKKGRNRLGRWQEGREVGLGRQPVKKVCCPDRNYLIGPVRRDYHKRKSEKKKKITM